VHGVAKHWDIAKEVLKVVLLMEYVKVAAIRLPIKLLGD